MCPVPCGIAGERSDAYTADIPGTDKFACRGFRASTLARPHSDRHSAMGHHMQFNRRDSLKAFFTGVAAASLPSAAAAYPVTTTRGGPYGQQSFTLPNGMRTHFIANNSGYV